jgi:hypothetical protein
MATVTRSASYPNVLLVTGDDVVTGDYRGNLQRLFEGSSSPGPVRSGSHDFWATYQVGSAATPNHSWADPAVRPRLRRGILELAAPPAAWDAATLSDRLGTLIHEVGHGWLVPRDLTVRSAEFWPAPGRVAPGMDGYDASIAFTEGSRFWGPALVARQGSHWSAWMSSGGSCMDGLAWRGEGDSDGLDRWGPQALPPVTLSPVGLPELALGARYGDVDLVLMGVISPAEAFAVDGNRLRWLEPRLMAPLDYHAGLVVLFGFNDALYFGFHTDHRQLAVQRTNGSTTTASAMDNRPFPDATRAVALRIIRRGNTYVFQARYSAMTADLLARHLAGSDSWPPPTAGPVTSEWTTVAVREAAERPLAVGMGVKTWRPILCEAHFQHLELYANGAERVLTTAVDLPAWIPSPTSGLSALPDRLVRYQPAAGSRVRRRDAVATVATPWNDFDAANRYVEYDSFDDWSSVNRSPKLLAAAPPGDFVIATTARIDRSGLSPWAGGDAGNKTMWGRERSAPMSDVVLPAWLPPLQAPPPGNAYKTAFMIIARSAADIRPEHERAVDTLRRYFDAAMPHLTRNRRTSDSTL